MRLRNPGWSLLALALIAGCGSNNKINTPLTPSGSSWVQTSGPTSTSVYAMIASGSGLYLGTARGIERSNDLGQSWTIVDENVGRAFLLHDGFIFAGTSTALLRSSNGTTWDVLSSGASDPVLVLAARGKQLFAVIGASVRASSDGGNVWFGASAGLPAGQAVTAMLNSAVAGKFLATTLDGGLYQLDGSTFVWSPAGPTVDHLVVDDLFETGTRVLAATTDRGVLALAGDGTWVSSSNGMPATTWVLDLSGNANVVYASTNRGIFRSTDQGQRWIRLSAPLPEWTTFSSALSVGTWLFAGTHGVGILHSFNQGSTWFQIGPSDAYTSVIAEAGGVLMAGTNNGLFLSNVAGDRWDPSPIGNVGVSRLAAQGTMLFAGLNPGGVRRSSDDGTNWTEVNNGLPGEQAVLELTTHGPALLVSFVDDPVGLYRSTDQGVTWAPSAGLPARPFVTAIVSSGTRALAGYLADGGGIAASTDGGLTWTPSRKGIPGGELVHALVVVGSRIFALTTHGSYVSTDAGTTWAAETLAGQFVLAVATHGSDAVAVTTSGQLLRSSDAGESWKIDSAFPAYAFTVTAGSRYFFVGTHSKGVWKASL